jgi:hypothetical protein
MNLSDALSIVGLVVTIAGSVASVIVTVGGRPVFKQETEVIDAGLLGKKVTDHFTEGQVPRIFGTRIAFWNAGHKALYASEVVDGHPIRFQFGDGDGVVKILSLRTLCTSDDANKFDARIDSDGISVVIKFDYLQRQQGGLFEIVRTGGAYNASSSGKIKSLRSGVREIDRSGFLWPVAFMAFGYVTLISLTVALGSGHISLNTRIWDAAVTVPAAFSILLFLRALREPRKLSLSRKYRGSPLIGITTRMPYVIR